MKLGSTMFQSLTRDSNHSNKALRASLRSALRFNPSRGIAIIQTRRDDKGQPRQGSFNPSRGIAIIQTFATLWTPISVNVFQSLTRDSNHSNRVPANAPGRRDEFQSLTRDSNHSNPRKPVPQLACTRFQSLTRDSNHSNLALLLAISLLGGFNPSRGIAIIQTLVPLGVGHEKGRVSIPHAG